MKQLLTSVRTLLRFKTYTFINLIGLVFSLACAVIIVRYIHQERTVDHYCPELERTFLMTHHQNGQVGLSAAVDYNKHPSYYNPLDDPCVERQSLFITYPDSRIMTNNRTYNVNMLAADSAFLQILPFPLITGSNELQTPNDAILTKRLAEKLFGNENPIGKVIKINDANGEEAIVIGIIDEPATKSSILFDIIVNIKLQWVWTKMEYQMVQLYRPEDVMELNRKNEKPMLFSDIDNNPLFYQLIPMKEYYLHSDFEEQSGMMQQGNATSLHILSLVVLMLILVGIFNYVNLHTVLMLKRAKEFGLKKVFGAKRWQIFAQLYEENFCLSGVALLLIWWVVEITRGVMVQWFNIPVKTDLRFDLWITVLLLFGLPIVTSLFPFIRYNFTMPIQSLRSINNSGKSIVSRTLFIFLQYTITICLLVAAIYFNRQLYYVLNFDVNYNIKDIIECQLSNQTYYNGQMTEEEAQASRERRVYEAELIKDYMDKSPLFTNWCFGYNPPTNKTPFGVYPCVKEDGKLIDIRIGTSNQKYMEIFGFKLKEGRIWDDGMDQSNQYKLIVNESLIRELGITDYAEKHVQFTKRLWYSVGINLAENPPFEIVGVIEDFKLGHLSQADVPYAFMYVAGQHTDKVYAVIAPGKRQEAIAYLADIYRKLNGEAEFEYRFIEDLVAELYEEDRRATRIYSTFAIIAILVSCLGLFGLSLYDIEQRYREIALRKVHGAKARDIFHVLLHKYYLTLGIAFVVASAISYFGIHRYMQDYAHHAPVSWWIFLLAGIITLLISLGTISWQIRKAIRINPAEAMKRE